MQKNDISDKISNVVDECIGSLDEKEKKFNDINLVSKSVIRQAGLAITNVHNKGKSIEDNLKELKGTVEKLMKMDKGFEYYTYQAYQEYVEAEVFYNLVYKGKFLDMKDLDVSAESYLDGLMDVVGELKREIISSLMGSKFDEAKKFFGYMEVIYDKTRSVRFQESILPGFRKKQDVARIQIESAGNELVLFLGTHKVNSEIQ